MKITFLEFSKILKKNFLFEKNPYVAVGVSGGPDSIALAFLLSKWIKIKKGKLIALIIDHQIRKESYVESLHVKKLLNLMGIENRILRVKSNKILMGSMDQARRNRFRKIVQYCISKKIFHVFLGHHNDDNIETFLLRKIAGSNLEGLNCMQITSVYDKVQLMRPLLTFTKKQILDFNGFNNLKYITDPSNENFKYSRVIVRKHLEKNKIDFKNVIIDFKIVRKNYKDYKKMIFQIFNSIIISISKNILVFESKKFLCLDDELQTKFIDISSKYVNDNKRNFRYQKIKRIITKLQKKPDVDIIYNNISIYKNYKILKISNHLNRNAIKI